jgi:hypothetical protein
MWPRSSPEDNDPALNGGRRSHIGAPGRTRTCGSRFRKPLLYPLSYGGVDGSGSGPSLVGSQYGERRRPSYPARLGTTAEMHGTSVQQADHQGAVDAETRLSTPWCWRSG